MPKTSPCGRWIALAMVLCVSTSSARAQMPSAMPKGRVPVLVALVDSPHRGASTVIVRQRNDARGIFDTIVLLNDASASARLAAAANVLATIMQAEGDETSRPRLVRLPDNASGPATELRAARRVLGATTTAQPSNVAGVGRARTRVIYLPDSTLRADLARRGRVYFNTVGR